MKGCRSVVAIIAIIFGLLIPSLAHAAPVMVTDRASLGGNDFVDWAVLGPSYTVVTSPFSIASNSGREMCTVSNPTDDFERLEQDNGWWGNFALGDAVLWTHFTVGPMIIEFDHPVIAAGAQIQGAFPGTFTAKLEVYDVSNTLIASFTLPGNSTSASDNSAIFLGVLDTGPTIKRIVYSVDNLTQDFAINRLALLIQTTSVPSMSRWGMIVFAFLLVVSASVYIRRKRMV
jgi:hypothetical protein